jgi:hypothetical protein
VNFELELIFHYGNSWPVILVENSTMSETLVDEFTKNVTITVDNLSDTLSISNIGKTDLDTILKDEVIVRDQFIEIKIIRANNISLDLNLIKDYCRFTPVYPQGYIDYCHHHNQTIETNINTYGLFFNGVWTFNFQTPFWEWYATLRKQLDMKYSSTDFIEKYIGTNHSVHQKLMNDLKKLLNV